ncbi:MAG: amidase [Burkholderiales bacterium]|nr:amidase [Burkholderiales bacterium]ODU65601.1 MAG: hypothetical protein ABT05_06010 [Lautropia sp. SCN 66-9]
MKATEDDAHWLSVAQASALIQARELSPVEYVEHLVRRIQTFDPQLHSFITPCFDSARQRARLAEAEIMAGRSRGPLHGIPFGVKDVYETADAVTTSGSRVPYAGARRRDAAIVQRLHAAGALLLGKLATHEFAHGGPSPELPWPVARNPWSTTRFTGGSSSGSAAAVAAGLLPAALGTDTGGSIRGPASYCGIAGFLPSAGLVSRAGVVPNSYTLDHCGPMARTVEDCALLLQAIAGHDPSDGNSFVQPIPDYRAGLHAGIEGLRIGVLRHIWEEELACSAEHRRALDETVATLRGLGARIADARIRSMRDYLDVKIVIGESEIFSVHHRQLIERAGEFGRDFLTRILPAVLFQSADYVAASREQRRMIAQMQALHARFDVLLLPGFGAAGPISAQRSLNFWTHANPHAVANLIGAPSLAVCCGFSEAGLPLGVQFMGPPLSDQTVLRVGHAYERATDWRSRRPMLTAGATAPALTEPLAATDPSATDAETRELALRLAEQAGLRLDDTLQAILFEAAPHALAMRRRLHRHDGSVFDEPAHVFRLPEQ